MDESAGRDLSRATIERMVDHVEPAWTVRESTSVEEGHTAVHEVTVATGAGTRELVLKATPEDGDPYGIETEARLLALLDDRTGIPVPSVLGAVDADAAVPDREGIRAPFLVMERVDPDGPGMQDVPDLPDAVLERTARETGAHLAELHALDAVSAFGFVTLGETPTLAGGRPPADPDQFAVDGGEDWPAVLSEWVATELDGLADTRFADLRPALREALDARVGALDGPFDPVLGRVDHGLHNLVVDPSTGRIEALLDLAFTVAAPPAYDLACVAFVLGGTVLSGRPRAPDRLDLAREAMLEGYRAAGGTLPPDADERLATYELLAFARSMNHLTSGLASVPEEHTDAAARAHRAAVERRLSPD